MRSGASRVAPEELAPSPPAGVPVFVPLSKLRQQTVLPRRGGRVDFSHPHTKQPNANLGQPYDAFDAAKTAYIFVSHRWLRPGNGAAGHPDDAANHKLRLIVRACEDLQGGPNAPIPADFEIAVWVDFCCIDQDGAPASELEQLGALIQQCDLLLTPVHDPGHKEWAYPTLVTNWYTQYKAAGWAEYWSRGCRGAAPAPSSAPHAALPLPRAPALAPSLGTSPRRLGYKSNM